MNNIKPLWLFSGVFLVVILWMMEFGNRPRMMLAMPAYAKHSYAKHSAGNPLDSDTLRVNGASQKETARTLSAPLTRNAEKQSLPATETGVYPTVSGNPSKPSSPSSSASKLLFNNPLRPVDEAYVCFDGSCLPPDY